MNQSDYQKINNFLEKYGSEYPESVVEYIKENYQEAINAQKIPDLMTQVYAELNLLSPNKNRYLRYLRSLKSYFSLEQDILEVGGGFFPSFAKYIAKEQSDLQRGSITVYDPRLVTKRCNKIRLKKEKLTLETKTEPYDLLLGIMPCDATLLLIEKASQDNKQFFLALCGCTHFNSAQFMLPSYENWKKYLFNYAEKSLTSELFRKRI